MWAEPLLEAKKRACPDPAHAAECRWLGGAKEQSQNDHWRGNFQRYSVDFQWRATVYDQIQAVFFLHHLDGLGHADNEEASDCSFVTGSRGWRLWLLAVAQRRF